MSRAVTEVPVQTSRIVLVPASPAELLEKWQSPGGTFAPEVSAGWIEKLRVSGEPDPWVLGFFAVHRHSQERVGTGGFKGEPDASGLVEIAYGVDEPYRSQGLATEIASALVEFAFDDARVKVVCAHTLPGARASARVLEKCGFLRVSDVVDPEDGVVWRFERRR